MKVKFANLFFIGLLSIFFVSCSSKSNVPVPEDAAFVLHIDGASLSSKLPWEEMKQSELFKMAMEEAKDSFALKILNNPEASGININSDAYLFTKNRGKGGYTAIICGLKDPTKFESFLKQIDKETKVETKDGISVASYEDNLITWKKDRLVMLTNTPGLYVDVNKSGEDFTKDSLIVFAKEIYDLKKSNSIGSNSKFASLLKNKGDMHIWVNAGALYSGAIPAVLAITKAGLLFEGNITTATINFDDGKITLKAKNYLNKEIEALFKKYKSKAFDEAAFQQIPAGNVDALFAFSYPPEGLKDFFALLGVDGLMNVFLAETGFSIEEFVKANKGEILFSVSDFKVESKEVTDSYGDGETYTYTTESPSAKLLFANSVKDKASFEKMINVIKETISKQSGGANMDEMMNKIPYRLTDKWFLAGNDSLAVHSFGTATTNHAFISKIKGHPMGGFLNIQNFIKGSKKSFAKDSTATAVADKSIQTWEDIVFYGGAFKNDGVESHVEINMVDKKTNSLKQLNNYLGFIAKLIQEKEKLRKQQFEDMDILSDPNEN